MGDHNKTAITIRVTGSKGSSVIAPMLITAESRKRKPSKRTSWNTLPLPNENCTIKPSMNIAKNELAFEIGSINETTCSGMVTPISEMTMSAQYRSNGTDENRRFAANTARS